MTQVLKDALAAKTAKAKAAYSDAEKNFYAACTEADKNPAVKAAKDAYEESRRTIHPPRSANSSPNDILAADKEAYHNAIFGIPAVAEAAAAKTAANNVYSAAEKEEKSYNDTLATKEAAIAAVIEATKKVNEASTARYAANKELIAASGNGRRAYIAKISDNLEAAEHALSEALIAKFKAHAACRTAIEMANAAKAKAEAEADEAPPPAAEECGDDIALKEGVRIAEDADEEARQTAAVEAALCEQSKGLYATLSAKATAIAAVTKVAEARAALISVTRAFNEEKANDDDLKAANDALSEALIDKSNIAAALRVAAEIASKITAEEQSTQPEK